MSAEFFPAVRSLVWAARSKISSKYARKIVQNMRTTKWAHDATHVSIPQRDNSRGCLNDSEASVFSAIALRKQYSWCIWQTDWAKQSLSSTSYLHSHPIVLISHDSFWSSILWHANLVQVCLPWRAGRWICSYAQFIATRIYIHFMCAYLCLLALTFVCNSTYLLKCSFQIYQKGIVVFIRSSKVWFKTTWCAKGPVTRCNFPGNLQRNSTLKRCKLVTNVWYVKANCDGNVYLPILHLPRVE